MRRVAAAAALVGALAGSGVADALIVNGSPRADRLKGTAAADAIYGRAGGDVIDAGRGADFVRAGLGRDRVLGGPGPDRIAVQADGAVDRVACGAGRDVVNAEPFDRVGRDCERVAVQLSRDPYTNVEGQHETQVEPDSFSNGATIVAAFQSGRYLAGGASNIGFATSTDAGRTWQAGFLPGLSAFSSPAGGADVVTDPAVAYDARHRVWLVASLAVARSFDAFLVSRSPNGRTWSLPVTAARTTVEAFDKEWIACDNWRSSPFYGRCYITYLDLVSGELGTIRSTDGGLTWSRPVAAARRTPMPFLNGAQPVVLPSGALVVVFTDFAAYNFTGSNHVAAIRSLDGGVTFGRSVRVGELSAWDVFGMRSPPFASVEVDGGGTIHAAWHDCGFRDCVAADIVVASSRDGVTWSQPRPLPLAPEGSSTDYFVPGLAADPASSGRRARLAIAYHSLAQCDIPGCRRVDVWLVTSEDAGATWSRPQRLTAEGMPLEWIAETNIGRMLGDYISTSFANGRPVPVFSLSSEPQAGGFRQAIFALRDR